MQMTLGGIFNPEPYSEGGYFSLSEPANCRGPTDQGLGQLEDRSSSPVRAVGVGGEEALPSCCQDKERKHKASTNGTG